MPEQVAIDGGMELVRAAPATPPGRVRDCYNYEVGWRRGMARIDGFERFDGSTSPSSTTGWVLLVNKGDVTGTFVAPENLSWVEGEADGDSGTLVAIEDAGADWRYFIIFRTGRVRPVYGATITGDDSGASFLLDPPIVGIKLPDYYATHAEYIDALHDFATTLRIIVRPVPGGGTIVGIHFHEDQVYAIRDAAEFLLASSVAGIGVGVGSFVVSPTGQLGEVIAYDADLDKLTVAALTEDGFTAVATDVLDMPQAVRVIDSGGAFAEGDSVLGAGSAWLGDVLLFDVRNGSLDSDNGEGLALFLGLVDGQFDVAEQVDNQTQTGQFDVESVLQPQTLAAMVVGSVSSTSDTAALWRSTDEGWEAAATGRHIGFDTGTTDPFDPTPIEQSVTPKFGSAASQTVSSKLDWTNVNNVLADDGANAGVEVVHVGPLSNYRTESLKVSDFKVGVDEHATITGIEVEVQIDRISGGGSARFYVAHTGDEGYDESSYFPGFGLSTHVFGSPTTKWADSLTPERLNDADFRFDMYATSRDSFRYEVDYLSITVYYTISTGERLYLWDGVTDIGWIRVKRADLNSGAWDGTGEGTMQLFDWSITSVPSGTEIRTQSGGLGLLVAVATTDVTTEPLPGSNLLNDNRSRYQMISYNFFASEDRNAIYGVSGAGRAFWYDGSSLEFIGTGLDVDMDKPRHLAPHEFRLALGYKWGEVYVSVPGDPTSYDGQLFASTFGFGEKITGLMPISGDALGVFTESSVHVLTGAHGDAQNPPNQKVINHKVGAIEYTVQSAGNRPIFASFRGIETLETMDQFGDFFTAPLTYDVTPFLLGRLQTAAGLEASDESVVNSVVVRNKNQYRLFFADGFVLTLTYVGPEKTPQVTTQQYYFNDDREEYLRVFATASGVTSDGRDRAFISAEERPLAPDAQAQVVSPELDFVYELDRGRSFDGAAIEANFTLSYLFGSIQQQTIPEAIKRYNIMHIHGTVAGFASLYMARAINYEELDDPDLPHEDCFFGALSEPPEDKQRAKFAKARMSGRGFALSTAFFHKSDREFPHTLQMLSFLDDDPTTLNR